MVALAHLPVDEVGREDEETAVGEFGGQLWRLLDCCVVPQEDRLPFLWTEPRPRVGSAPPEELELRGVLFVQKAKRRAPAGEWSKPCGGKQERISGTRPSPSHRPTCYKARVGG